MGGSNKRRQRKPTQVSGTSPQVSDEDTPAVPNPVVGVSSATTSPTAADMLRRTLSRTLSIELPTEAEASAPLDDDAKQSGMTPQQCDELFARELLAARDDLGTAEVGSAPPAGCSEACDIGIYMAGPMAGPYLALPNQTTAGAAGKGATNVGLSSPTATVEPAAPQQQGQQPPQPPPQRHQQRVYLSNGSDFLRSLLGAPKGGATLPSSQEHSLGVDADGVPKVNNKIYTLDELKTGTAWPAGIEPACREAYLSVSEFERVMGCTKKEFYQLAVWRRIDKKKSVGLF